MPRHPDLEVEGHILDAAYRLWKNKGEKGVTMRAVAREAKTTTPTVYQRFRDKRDILEALRRRAQQKLFLAVETSRSIPDFCRRYLAFASKHQHEYELIHAEWAARLAREEPRPSFELLKLRLSERLGGGAEQHRRLALALAAISHGTAMLLLGSGVDKRVSAELQKICISAAETLVGGSGRRSSRKRARRPVAKRGRS
ncbi:MAG: TetR/AcrR family transcriptional regulator [Candidatus Acidiferrales bacterium]